MISADLVEWRELPPAAHIVVVGDDDLASGLADRLFGAHVTSLAMRPRGASAGDGPRLFRATGCPLQGLPIPTDWLVVVGFEWTGDRADRLIEVASRSVVERGRVTLVRDRALSLETIDAWRDAGWELVGFERNGETRIADFAR